MKFDYLTLRLIRHFMPRPAVHFLLRYNLIIQPGFETREPKERIENYRQILERSGRSFRSQSILNFGYGGNFALACGLLEAGASHVTLLDKFAPPENFFNRQLLPRYEQYLTITNGKVLPRSGFIELLQADLFDLAAQSKPPEFDIVLSSSVYEHLDQVERITQALAALTKLDGCQIHFIDLRDHYFKYPFEMLAYSESAWQKWLNPGSNLNRYRYTDYKQAFQNHFKEVRLEVLERDLEKFERARQQIRPEFLTGDPAIDAVTLLQVYAAGPIQTQPANAPARLLTQVGEGL